MLSQVFSEWIWWEIVVGVIVSFLVVVLKFDWWVVDLKVCNVVSGREVNIGIFMGELNLF